MEPEDFNVTGKVSQQYTPYNIWHDCRVLEMFLEIQIVQICHPL